MKTIKIAFYSFFFILLFASCSKDFLKEEVYSNLAPSNFYKSEQDAIAAVSAVYNNLQLFGNEFWNQGLAWTDMTMASTDVMFAQWSAEYENYTFNSGGGDFLVMWKHVYNTNNKANAVIGRLPDIPMNAALKTRLIAETKFLRAMNYFNAVRWWGDVPVILEETMGFSDIKNVTRTPKSQVYDQIIKDLQEAIQELPVSYTNGSDAGRATKGAAKAMLGKVYLTRGWGGGASSINTADLQLAVGEFEALMTAPYSYKLTDSLTDEWDYTKENKPEFGYIFSAQYSKGLGFEGSWYAQNMQAMELESAWWGYSAPESWVQGTGGFQMDWGSGNPVPVDKRLKYLWEDYTQLWWYYWCKKWRYEKYLGWAEHPQNYPIIRYGDILLMHSEALNELKGSPDAEVIASINLIRKRAGVAEYNPADWTKVTFREEIQNERNRELWGEGVTWFDYVRKGMLVSRMTAAGTANVTDKFNLFPVPQLEIDNNSNLTPQNAGW